ncbi:MAG TPA: substrate-binding domain-containing protein, partial [Rubrivivax sp.]|nr:substrate-binding domain-containing protein [Rubrivivax sp.]
YSALFVSGHWNARHEARCIDTLRARRVDGVIVLTGRLSDATLAGYARSMPVVVTGRRQSAPGLMALDFDNFGGARLAVEHLLGLGHRRIAFISGDMRHPDSKERLRGYRSALEAAGVPLHAALILAGAYTEESGRIAVEQLLDRGERFSAVFAANDQMAYGARLALHRRGLQVPGDVSLVGFDDLASSVYSIPPLTTVHHPIYELGQLAATALLQLLAGERPAPTMPQPRLIARESTAPPR